MDFKQVILSCSNFESNYCKEFQELREEGELFDVTLACKEGQLEAHRVILSSCSMSFKDIFKKNRHVHPIIYMKGVKFCHLKAVVDFMYQGRVSMEGKEVDTFMDLARELQVNSLSTADEMKSENQLRLRKPEDLFKPIVLGQKSEKLVAGSFTNEKESEQEAEGNSALSSKKLETENEELERANAFMNEEKAEILESEDERLKIEKLERMVDEANAKAASAQALLSCMEATVKDSEERIANLVAEKADLQRESNAKRIALFDAWRKERSDQRLEKSKRVNHNLKLREEKIKLTKMVQDLTAAKKNQDVKMAAIKAELGGLKQNTAHAQEEAKKLQVELKTKMNEHETLQEQNARSNDLQVSLQSNVDALKKKVSDMEEAMTLMTNTMQSAANNHKIEKDSLKSKAGSMRKELMTIRKELEAADQANKAKDSEIEALKSQVWQKEVDLEVVRNQNAIRNTIKRAEYGGNFCWRWNRGSGHCWHDEKSCHYQHKCGMELENGAICGSKDHGKDDHPAT